MRRHAKATVAISAMLFTFALGASAASADTPPAVTIGPVSQVGVTAAHLTGTVNPNGGPSTTYWHFEVAPVDEPDNWIYAYGEEINPPASEGTSAIPVQGNVEGLQPNREYVARLIAENQDFANRSETLAPRPSFTTGAATAPVVTAGVASNVKYTTAHFTGTIDPNGGNLNPTSGPTPIYWNVEVSSDGGANWFWVGGDELSGADAESDDPVAVQADGTGMQPGTTYQFRLLANYASFAASVASAPAAATFQTDPAAKPAVVLDPVSAITDESASFDGTINPNAPKPNAELDDEAKAVFDTTWHFECTPACPNTPGSQTFAADNQAQAVSFDPKDLEPGTSYTVRLYASNAGGETVQERSFETTAIGVGAATAGANSLTDASARLTGFVDPNNKAATYYFQWGTQPNLAGAQSLPATEDASAGGGNGWVAVGRDLTGLQPQSTYYFRIVADNAVGVPVQGEIHSFTTYAAPQPENQNCPNAAARAQQNAQHLPECRAYELVSAPDLGGTSAATARLSENSNRAIYSTAGSAPGAHGGIATFFAADRGAAGWTAQTVDPVRVEGKYQLVAPEALAPDLSRIVAFGKKAAGGIDNLRIRPGEPEAENLTATLNFPWSQARYASEDLDRVFAYSAGSTGPGFPPKAIFEIGTDTPTLVSVLPNGDPAGCPVWSGQGRTARMHFASVDGSRFFFRALESEDCSSPPGIYLRTAGPGRDFSSPLASTVRIDQPAPGEPEVGFPSFLSATPDGSEAFFLSAANLSGDPAEEGGGVYRYDVATGERTCVTCVTDGPSGAQEAYIAENGDRVYFTSSRVLAPGAKPGVPNLYLVAGGSVRFVAVTNGPSAVAFQGGISLSPDGSTLLFEYSSEELNALTGTDNGGFQQVYRYDAVRDQIDCVSCALAGVSSSGSRADISAFMESDYARNMSAEGDVVAFATEMPLIAADVNGRNDIYRWRRGHGVALITDGRNPLAASVVLQDVSSDGSSILFRSDSKLTPEVLSDSPPAQMYVARTGGGFLPPAPPVACAAVDVCHGGPTAPPSTDAPASSQFSGPGNAVVKHCAKGKARKNGRCVTKPKKQSKKSKKRGKQSKRAGANRGGGK